jgi:hypothetical protein
MHERQTMFDDREAFLNILNILEVQSLHQEVSLEETTGVVRHA